MGKKQSVFIPREVEESEIRVKEEGGEEERARIQHRG